MGKQWKRAAECTGAPAGAAYNRPMNLIADGAYTGAVLYTDISTSGAAAETPLAGGEVRDAVAAVARGGGAVMEATSRRLLAFFGDAQAALAAAREVLARLSEPRIEDGVRRTIDCRMVLGFGPVTVERGRLRSEWTHRLHGQVLRVPQNTIAALPTFVERFAAGQITYRRLTPSLFTIDPVPQEVAATRMPPVTQLADAPVYTTLVLRVRGMPQTVRSSDCPVQVGRDPSCGVQIQGEFVSRVHGRFEFFNDKFHYVDGSRNGSYVLTGGGDEVRLKREKLMLVGEGAISPGVPIAQQTGDVVRYQCNATRLRMAGDGDTAPVKTTRERARRRTTSKGKKG